MRSPTLVSLVAGLLILSGAFWLLERWPLPAAASAPVTF
jgi:hypothetical protein